MTFEFATAGRIMFGAGVLRNLGPVARELGRKPLIVCGHGGRHVERLATVLASVGLSGPVFKVSHEPTTGDVQHGMSAAIEGGCDFVIGIGGGSVIDAAKAVSALMTNREPIAEYLEVIGRAKPLERAAAPCIAIPTTAGTGAEVTRNAVLASVEHRVKVSLRSPLMLPRVALVDPELTYDLPPALTATTGLDALTQLIEPYVCSRANPLTDGICLEGLPRVARSLETAVEHGGNAAARLDMAVASLCGGLALANAGLGAVHGFAGPIGGSFPAPHGAVCAILLPHTMAANLRAARAHAPQSDVLRRFDHVARVLTGRPSAQADDAVTWLQGLIKRLQVPRLGTYGVAAKDIPELVKAASRSSSMKANPVPLTPEECAEVLTAAL